MECFIHIPRLHCKLKSNALKFHSYWRLVIKTFIIFSVPIFRPNTCKVFPKACIGQALELQTFWPHQSMSKHAVSQKSDLRLEIHLILS
jgi:hypothetical protein